MTSNQRERSPIIKQEWCWSDEIYILACLETVACEKENRLPLFPNFIAFFFFPSEKDHKLKRTLGNPFFQIT